MQISSYFDNMRYNLKIDEIMEKTTTRKIRIYSERKIRACMWYFSIPMMLFVFLRLIIKDAESWLLLLIWPVMLGLISFLSSKIGKLLDLYLWIFEKDKIIRKIWNHTQSYSYLDVIHALQKNPLKVTKNGYVVPLPDRESRDKIVSSKNQLLEFDLDGNFNSRM